MKKNIPNAITLLNLFSGCCALASVFYGQFDQVLFFSLVSMAADYLDGMVARALKVKSPLGQQLDSLADMVSFGVVPGAIIYMLLVKGLSGAEVFPIELTIAASPAFLISLFAALRLGRFNLDLRQAEHFLGLPTPSCAAYAVGLMMIYRHDSFGLAQLICHPVFLYLNIPLLCWLMVANFTMFSLKLKNFAWEGNEIRYIFAAVSVLLLLWLREAALSFIIVVYVLISAVHHFFIQKTPLHS
jgi:CDP-diacylglycerol--serine O-phosphatidyltransferase